MALGVVAAMAVWSDRRDRRRIDRGLAAAEHTAAREPGPPDGRDPGEDDVPDGPAWADHQTHDLRADEESPRFRMPRKARPE